MPNVSGILPPLRIVMLIMPIVLPFTGNTYLNQVLLGTTTGQPDGTVTAKPAQSKPLRRA